MGGNKETELGEHELGPFAGDETKISAAVAASSAFPPAYPLLQLNQEFLSDKVDCVTVTDGGKPFVVDPNSTTSGAIVLKVLIGILMEQVSPARLCIE